MKTNLILIIFLILLSVSVPAQAAPIDDLLRWTEDVKKDVRSLVPMLSIPGVGTTTVSCKNGATCAFSGDNWHISTTILSANQNLALTLPSGTEYLDTATNTKLTTGSAVTLNIRPDRADVRRSVKALTLTYRTCYLGSICGSPKLVPGYENSGASSYKTIYYAVDLTSSSGTTTKNMQYSYDNQQSFLISDNNGNQAQIFPKYVVDTGYNLDLSGILYLDNGYGTYRPYTSSSFVIARQKVDDDMTYNVAGLPKNWAEYVTAMKKYGLVEVSDIGQPTISNQQVIVSYPGGSVGITGDILIPKAMASTVSVQLNYGNPRIDKITVSPSSYTIGQATALNVNVFVTNVGSEDWVKVGVSQNVGNINYISNRKYLKENEQTFFTIQLLPTVTSPQTMRITATATAEGSKKASTMTKDIEAIEAPKDCNWFGTCTPKTQAVTVIAYDPNKAVLGNAPIYMDGVQIGKGRVDKNVVYGSHVFSTSNDTNPNLFAPVPIEVTFSGGEAKVVSLYFSDVPVEDEILDFTWVFWLVAFAILGWLSYTNQWYHHWQFWVGLAVLYILYQILKVAMGIADSINEAATNPWLPWNW